MTFDPNDPRLTAYVLGELDPSERPEFEAMLESSPDARQAVVEIGQTIGWLSERLREEQATHNDTPPAPAAPPPGRWSRKVVLRLSAVAALLLICGTVGIMATLRSIPAPHFASYRKQAPAERGVLFAEHAPASPKMRARANRSGAMGLEPRGFDTEAQGQPQRQSGQRNANPDPRFKKDSSRTIYHSPVATQFATHDANSPAPAVASAPAQQGQSPALLGRSYDRQSLAFGRSKNGAQLPSQPGQGNRQQMGGMMPAQAGQARPPITEQMPGLQAGPTNLPQMSSPMVRLQKQGNSQAPNSGQAGQGQANNQMLALAGAKQSASVQNRKRKEALDAAGPSVTRDQNQLRALSEKEAKDKAPNEQQLASLEPTLATAPQAGEVFAPIVDNPFIPTTVDAQSTFSIDVDTAGYANVRRYLTGNMLPPKDAVRIEELLNYFPYDDAPPPESSPDPFAVHVEIAACPWNASHRLARVGIAARPIDQSRRPPSNLVFLLDVSGSMNEELPMIKWGLTQLVEQLNENDRVAIVVYASASGLVLPSTSCLKKAEILGAIDRLHSGGSTNGGAGMQLAYQVAVEHFIKNGTNRVIWATDGDFNVGVTGQDALVKLVQAKAKSGVFLTVLGCGTGNIKDGPLEQIADKGNGHYAYIDAPKEAYRVLVEQMGSTLVTVAKDVKIQLDFERSSVAAFRLIGYENRVMAHQDFNDDTKDAGEIGAGHHVTALYELAPTAEAAKGKGSKLMTVKLRYKKPAEDNSRLLEFPAQDPGTDFGHASDDLKLATAVAGFGMLLRDSPYKGTLTYAGDLEIARSILPRDRSGYRQELVTLIERARTLTDGHRR